MRTQERERKWYFANEQMPPVGKVVEVWYQVTILRAVWTGRCWQTPEGQQLTAQIINWREYRA